MSISKRLAVSLACSMLGSAITLPVALGATEKEKPLIVTASRFASSIDTAPVNVTVITSEQIHSSGSRNLGEILEQEAGIHVQHLGGTGGTIDLAGFGETRGQNSLVLVNGRRINDIDLNGVNLDSIPLASVARVEIIRGSSAVLYGDNATGGVINIVTHSGLDGDAVQLRTGFGSWNTAEVGTSLRNRNGRHGLALSADAINSDGYRDNSAYQRASLNGEYAYESHTGAVTGVRLQAHDQDNDYPGALHEPDYEAAPDSSSSLQQSTERRHAIEGFFTGSLFSGELSSREKKQTSVVFGTTEARLSTHSFTPRLRWASGVFSITGGSDIYVSTLETDADFGIAHNQSNTSRDSLAFYVAPELKLGSVSIGIGGRYQQVDLDMKNTDLLATTVTEEDRKDKLTAADVNIGWQIGENTRLHLRGARSFRFPVLDEMWNYFSGTMTLLKPQTGDHLELGMRTHIGSVAIEGELFDIRLEDEISYDAITFSNVNLEPTRHRGADLRARPQRWLGPWKPSLSIGYRDAKFDGGANDGKIIPQVPKLKAGLSNRFRFNTHNELTLNAVYTGARYFGDDNGNDGKKMPAHVLYDLGWRYSRDDWKMKLSINNLFDRQAADAGYYATYLAPPYTYYPLNGRNYHLSIESSF